MLPEQPSAGVISRLTVRVSEGAAELGNGLSSVTVRPHTSVEYQNHCPAAPILFCPISFQWPAEFW